MAEFKKLSAVEAVETVSETANVLIEENGVIKRAPKNEVGGSKVEKELVYEWNFSVDDEVYEIVENTNNDLTWLTEKTDNIGWEIVTEVYAQYYDSESNAKLTEPGLTSTMLVTDNSYYVAYHSNNEMSAYSQCYAPEDFHNDWYKQYAEPWCDFCIYNKVNFDFDNGWVATHVDVGGAFYIYGDAIFKSVKIYKITR